MWKIKIGPDRVEVRKIPASKLSLQDAFMQHQPKTDCERRLKVLITQTISHGLHDFYVPIYDPSFDNYGKLCFQKHGKPAVGQNFRWWEKEAKRILPEYNSRLGSFDEYVAFLAVLIKTSDDIEEAWNYICNDSSKIGHYANSTNANSRMSSTGSRKYLEFFDLANVYKILAYDKKNPGYWIASGTHNTDGTKYPVASLSHRERQNNPHHDGVGWIVFY